MSSGPRPEEVPSYSSPPVSSSSANRLFTWLRAARDLEPIETVQFKSEAARRLPRGDSGSAGCRGDSNCRACTQGDPACDDVSAELLALIGPEADNGTGLQ